MDARSETGVAVALSKFLAARSLCIVDEIAITLKSFRRDGVVRGSLRSSSAPLFSPRSALTICSLRSQGE